MIAGEDLSNVSKRWRKVFSTSCDVSIEPCGISDFSIFTCIVIKTTVSMDSKVSIYSKVSVDSKVSMDSYVSMDSKVSMGS